MDEPFKTHGAFSWFELMTTDPKAAKDFYTKLFGWTTEEMNNMPGMTYTVVKAAGNTRRRHHVHAAGSRRAAAELGCIRYG